MRWAVWTLLAAALVGTTASAAPLSAYGRLPAIEQVEISPDGKSLAMISTTAEQRRIIIRATDSLRTISIINAGDQKVRDLQWAGSNYLLITVTDPTLPPGVTGPRAERAVTTYYDVAKNKQQTLIKPVQERAMNVSVGPPMYREVSGKPMVLIGGIQFVRGVGRVSLFSVNLATGDTVISDQGEEATRSYIAGPDGRPLARFSIDRNTGKSELELRRNLTWVSATAGRPDAANPQLLGPGRDPRSVLVGVGEDGRRVLREVSAEGVWSEPLRLPNPIGYVRDPATQALVGVISQAGEDTRYTFFAPADQAAWETILNSYPGEKVALASWSADRSKGVVKVESAAEGVAFALVNLADKKAVWLGGVYPEVAPKDIAQVHKVAYDAADGLKINGYLTLPNGKEAKNLPLVVLAHGGPAARHDAGFDWWAQALASRGYAVLQANFRGSEGYGPQFFQAGFGEWGKKMQTDLSDGVRHLAKEGVVDPRRVCIAGASYGGYAALAGATIDRGVYRFAASVAGPSDLARMISTAQRNQGEQALRYWSRFMGVDSARDPDLSAISPAALAAQADIPILLIHGREDSVVPYEQTRVMSEALRRADKPFELVTLDGEDHYLSRGDTRLKMLESMVAFLERNNPSS